MLQGRQVAAKLIKRHQTASDGFKVKKGYPETALALCVLLLGCVLALTGAHLLATERPSALNLQFLVGLGVTGFGLLVIAWWIATLCLAVAAEALARSGSWRTAQRVGALSPAFMRRMVCVALGAQLIAIPSAHADGPRHSHTLELVQARFESGIAPSPSPLWQTTEETQAAGPSWRPSRLPSDGSLLIGNVKAERADDGHQRSEVTVTPGDSLWSIASRWIGPGGTDADVAEAWPHWYAANKHIIGEHPDLLRPGQVLQPPAAQQ